MAITGKIKVNKVQVGDPNLTVTLACDDTGTTFPKYVQISIASVSNSNLSNNGTESVTGSTGPNDPLPTTVTIQCSFDDSAYAADQPFGYTITEVSFSDDGRNWTAFSGTYAQETDSKPWSGTVTSVDFAMADVAETPPVPKPAPRPMSLWQRILAFFRRIFGMNLL